MGEAKRRRASNAAAIAAARAEAERRQAVQQEQQAAARLVARAAVRDRVLWWAAGPPTRIARTCPCGSYRSALCTRCLMAYEPNESAEPPERSPRPETASRPSSPEAAPRRPMRRMSASTFTLLALATMLAVPGDDPERPR